MTFGGANSLDNYLARPDHAVDWLMWSQEAAAVMADSGRPSTPCSWAGRPTRSRSRRTTKGEGFPGVTSYVFSRTLKELPDGRGDARLGGRGRVRPGSEATGGQGHLPHGGRRAGELSVRGRADRRDRFNIHPVLLGSGIPLFLPMDRQIDLELMECKSFKNGCVLVRYRVKH